MFTDPEVDVIYITTPHNTHLGFMKEAIANGKHILVEKSMTAISFAITPHPSTAHLISFIVRFSYRIYFAQSGSSLPL